MTTLLDHRTTLAYLAYLGYGTPEAGTTSALTLGPPRRAQGRTRSGKGARERNVLCAFVLGAAGSGKTTLLSRFVGKAHATAQAYEPTGRAREAVNSVEIRGGGEKYLVLREFGRFEAEALRSAKRLAAADLVVFVYDSADTNSFTHVSNLRQQYKLLDTVPTLFVATKSDLDKAQQRHEVQPEEYARRLMLRAPTSISHTADLADVFRSITEAALAPALHGAVPGGGVARRSAWSVSLAWTVGAAVFGAASLVAWRWVVRPAGGLLALWAQLRTGRAPPREL
jgi:Ras family protein T1